MYVFTYIYTFIFITFYFLHYPTISYSRTTQNQPLPKTQLVSKSNIITLKDTILNTYKNNNLIQATKSNIKSYKYLLWSSTGDFLPTIEYKYDRYTSKDNTTLRSKTKNKETLLSVTQPIFKSGSSIAKLKANTNQFHKAKEDARAVIGDVLLNAITAFVNLNKYDKMLITALLREKKYEQQFLIIKEKLKYNLVSQQDYLLVESEYLNASSNTINIQRNLQKSIKNYSTIVGIDPSKLALEELEHIELPPMPTSLTELINQAKAHNPQLNSNLFNIKATNLDVANTIAENALPSANLFYHKYDTNLNISNNNSDNNINEEFGINVTIPIFKGGKNTFSAIAALYSYKKYKSQHTDAILKTEQKITNYWHDIKTLDSEIEYLDKYQASLSLVLDKSHIEMKEGELNYIDLLNTQEKYFDARIKIIEVYANKITSYFNILHLIGDLNKDYIIQQQ